MPAVFAVSRSLSAKLLLLTVLFVMVAEVLIYTPSIARFRLTYLHERLAAAHLAALSVEAAPDLMVDKRLQQKLLDHVNAHMIDLIQPDSRVYMLSSSMPPRDVEVVDLRGDGFVDMIADAFAALVRTRDRVIKVIDHSPRDPALRVELVMDEAPLIAAMLDFSGRILALSIVISLITAGLVFLTLNGMFVRPMRRLTESMVAFSRDPETATPTFAADGRRDELGVAQRELVAMQDALRTALRQRERLAALGTAVAKINHDLRAILSTAALLSEHLGESADPAVRKVTPRLMASIDRAVELCSQTLSYTRDGVLPLDRRPIDLSVLVAEAEAEVLAAVKPDGGRVAARWDNLVPPGTMAAVDPGQLSRVLVNLGRNAVQAGAELVSINAQHHADGLTLLVSDTGPGLPPRARANLFQPFAGSARAGGIGLGLATAREIARAHGGELRLVDSGESGTTFALDLPADTPL